MRQALEIQYKQQILYSTVRSVVMYLDHTVLLYYLIISLVHKGPKNEIKQ